MPLPATEFFRHLRPHRFNEDRMQVEPLQGGGISFLLSPIAEKTYNYWVYICPSNAPFSAKAAVKKLRQVKAAGTAPWGTIILSGERPIIDLLSASVASSTEFPSDLGALIKKFMFFNDLAKLRHRQACEARANSERRYHEERHDR